MGPVASIPGWRTRLSQPAVAIAAAAIGFGLLIHGLLPAVLTPVWTDEVGFLKSAVETIQHGRPWTDSYLEPWAASLSAIAALVYGGTGRISPVLHGVVVALAVLTFAGLCSLIRRRTNSVAAAIICAIVVLTCPAVLLRLSEFIGLVIFLPCLFWSLYAAETRRWGVFFVSWALAVATRQTALIWLAVPAMVCFETWAAPDASAGGWRRPALVVGLGLVWFGALSLGMNLNGVQLTHTLRPFDGLDRRSAAQAGVAIALFGAMAMGCAAAVIAATRGGSPARWTVARWAKLAVAVGLVFIDPRRLIMPDPQFGFIQGTLGWPYARIFALIAACGWAAGRFRIRRDLALCTVAMVGVVALRAVVYDCYGIEVASLAFFAIESIPEKEQARPIPMFRPAMLVAAGILACFSVPFTVLVKARIDDAAAWTQLHERALRTGLLAPSELGSAPLSVRAWYLHDYAVAHPLPRGRMIAAYLRFCEPTTDAWGSYPPKLAALEGFQIQPKSVPSRIIAAATFRVGWFWRVRYELDRIAPRREPGPLGPDYRAVPPLPLDEADWRRLITGPRLGT